MVSIYTIGYGNRSMDEFLKLLKQYEIQYLVDVRSAPYSKYNPSFSHDELHAAMKENDIGYLFLGQQLGGRPNDPSCYLEDGRVDYEVCEQKAFYQEGIQRLKTACEGGYRVVIMCSEAKAHECHRSKLIGRTLDKLQVSIHHIDENGDLKSQEEVIAAYHKTIGNNEPVQLSLWAETSKTPLFVSRKSYRNKTKTDEEID